MVMGTAEELPASVTEDTKEPGTPGPSSVPPAEKVEGLKLPVGIINLGNTCYMNSALQLLYTIPEIRTFVKRCGL